MDEFLPSQWCLDGSSQQQLFWRFSSTLKNLFINVLTKFSHRHWGEFSNFKLETKTITKELAKPMVCSSYSRCSQAFPTFSTLDKTEG